ncbi:MAG: hypothetical protein WBE72_18045 [Terracidiphilus sp.]
MRKPDSDFRSHQSLVLLSRLLLLRDCAMSSKPAIASLQCEPGALDRGTFEDLLMLAQSNHVLMRGLKALLGSMREQRSTPVKEWAEAALSAERTRIATALHFLHEICAAFEDLGYDVTVIKSLDHWPDLGSDLDLYTNADPEDISRLMRDRFDGQIAPRSWGDRLARKWNFLVPGLPEEVEVHVGRLGQAGEQVEFASSLAKSSVPVLLDGYRFRVPSSSDRLMISTLQRMYRHFYIRVCDVVDTVSLADAGGIDYEELHSLARAAGIWEGVATYLRIVSDYARSYRGSALNLPAFVQAAAQFGGDAVYFARGFLRVPILPQSARLYGAQLAGALRRGQLHHSARLSLLPWLATAAVVGQKLTGSDKGIW